jgi:hypothetical protein
MRAKLRSRLAPATIFALLTLVGCAGSSASTVPGSSTQPTTEMTIEPSVSVKPSPAPTPSPTPSPTPTPTPDIAAIGQQWLASAAKLANANAASTAAIEAAATDDELSAAYQLVVDALLQAINDYGGIELPASFRTSKTRSSQLSRSRNRSLRSWSPIPAIPTQR